VVQQQKMHGSQKCCDEFAELTVKITDLPDYTSYKHQPADYVSQTWWQLPVLSTTLMATFIAAWHYRRSWW